MKLVIYFCGTGDDGSGFTDHNLAMNQDPDISIVFVQGCENPNVCNSFLFPDLKAFANRFTTGLFNKSETTLQLNVTDNKIQDASRLGIDENNCNKISSGNIDSITLCGYSRGGVTCFEVARCLQKIAPNTPVNIVANQPVPGNLFAYPGSNAASIADCRDLTNVKNVDIILGTYTGITERTTNHLIWEGKDYDYFHRLGLSQVVPQLPHTTKSTIAVIPKEHHNNHSATANKWLYSHIPYNQGYAKMHDFLARTLGYETAYSSTTENEVNEIQKFPRTSELQSIFGMRPAELYRHLNKDQTQLRDLEDRWDGTYNNTIKFWEKKNVLGSAYFSTQLTKELFDMIKSTSYDANDKKNTESLKLLYQETHRWLLLKQGTSTSREAQVLLLNTRVGKILNKTFNLDQSTLDTLKKEALILNSDLMTKWKRELRSASFFKTKATDELLGKIDKIDKNQTPELLISTLGTWLDLKKTSSSKRYEMVSSMYRHLIDAQNPRESISHQPAS